MRRRERAVAMNKAKTVDEIAESIAAANKARLARPTSDETRRKISGRMKGRVFSEAHIAKIKKSKQSKPEYKESQIRSAERMNEARRNMSPEQVEAWKDKLRAGRVGKKLSEEHKAKIRAGMRAKSAAL